MKKLLPFILCLLGGWIAAFAMPPAGIWPCLFIGLSLLFIEWFKAVRYRDAFLTGFLFGIGYFTTGLWWIGNALLIEGNEFWWVWPISVIGLPTLLSVFTGFFCTLAKIFFKDAHWSTWAGFAGMLTLSEFIRGHIFTGFPWNLYGYAWSRDLEILQSASLLGAYGLTFITVFIAAAPGFIWLSRRHQRQAVAAGALSLLLLAALHGFGAWRLAQPVTYDDDVAVRVVQANIPQTMKWDPAHTIPSFEKHLRLSDRQKDAKSLYILWPETAIPPVLVDNPAARDKIETLLSKQPGKAALLTGALVHKNEKYFNALLGFDHRGAIAAAYAKTHLVPFGEFIPFQQWIPIRPVVRFQGFERGKGPVTLSVEGLPGFSPLVCYEIIFPGQVVDTRNRPAFLAAITNDGWYGKSAGPRQHFFQARMRAIEEGLPVARAANTGISGIIDPYGRVLVQSSLFEETALDHPLPAALAPPLFAKTGALFWLGALVVILLAAISSQPSRRR